MELTEYLIFINAVGVDPDIDISDDDLHKICINGIKLFNISDEVIAHRFDMSRPSVNRWKNGRNFPHPVMRQHIIKFFRDIANQNV